MGRAAVVFGGPSPEHDVSILTGLRAARALTDGGYDPLAIYWGKSGEWYSVSPVLEARDFADGPPRKAQELVFTVGPDGGYFARKRRVELSVAVNCTHGGPGEDGTLQAAFDLSGIRATGPTVAGAALGMDKYAFGGAVAAAGLRTLPRALLPVDGDPPQVHEELPPPYIVKPRFGGSSIGIEVVEGLEDAAALARSSPHLRDGALLEPFLESAHDVNIAIRTFPELQLSAIERPLRAGEGAILDYRQKYLRSEGLEGAPRELPADIPSSVADTIRRSAATVAEVALVRSVARLDFLMRGDEVWVNELNTIPGSLASYLWVEPKVPFEQLLLDMIAEAEKEPPRAFTTAGSDGTILRSAESIAAKLA
jgi:D-alanine-D-alanine ligase